MNKKGKSVNGAAVGFGILAILLFVGAYFTWVGWDKVPKIEPPTLIDQGLIADGTFDNAPDSAGLIADGIGQDWYASRIQSQSLLTLITNDVGGNSGAKARLAGGTIASTDNAYLTQELKTPQTARFALQWDVYVESIADVAGVPDRTGWALVGDDSFAGNGPNADSSERFVYLAFFRNGGGSAGTMDLVAVTRNNTFATQTIVASGLSIGRWYTIKVDVDVPAGQYHIYVDGTYKGTVSSKNVKSRLTHLSFAQWNDGAGSFLVDNVKEAAFSTIIVNPPNNPPVTPPSPLVLANGIAWWKLNGNSIDSVNGLNGVASNVIYEAVGTGSAARFNGIDAVIRVPHDSRLSTSGDFTITAKVNLANLQQGYIVSKRGDYLMQYLPAGLGFQVGVYTTSGGWGLQHNSVVEPVTGRWYRLDWTYQGATGTSSLYVDKVLDSTVTITPNKGVSTMPLGIGNNVDNTSNSVGPRPFSGLIQDVRIRNVAMTASQIAADN